MLLTHPPAYEVHNIPKSRTSRDRSQASKDNEGYLLFLDSFFFEPQRLAKDISHEINQRCLHTRDSNTCVFLRRLTLFTMICSYPMTRISTMDFVEALCQVSLHPYISLQNIYKSGFPHWMQTVQSLHSHHITRGCTRVCTWDFVHLWANDVTHFITHIFMRLWGQGLRFISRGG